MPSSLTQAEKRLKSPAVPADTVAMARTQTDTARRALGYFGYLLTGVLALTVTSDLRALLRSQLRRA